VGTRHDAGIPLQYGESDSLLDTLSLTNFQITSVREGEVRDDVVAHLDAFGKNSLNRSCPKGFEPYAINNTISEIQITHLRRIARLG
jgi:hypothetical protein